MSATKATVDFAFKTLDRQKDVWVQLPAKEKVALLTATIASYTEAKENWASAILKCKGVDNPDENDWTRAKWAEELFGNTYVVVQYLRRLKTSWEAITATGKPPQVESRTTSSGQVVVKSYPLNAKDKQLNAGVSGEIFVLPGKPLSQGHDLQRPNGEVCVVLGANNVSMLGVLDVLDHLFVRNQVVFLKHSDVMGKAAQAVEGVLFPLIQKEFIQCLSADIPTSAYIVNHPLNSAIHFTGGLRTYNAIVWGPEAEQEERKRSKQPFCAKQVTAELGNVTPYIIVPGQWTEKELKHYAGHAVNGLAGNVSCNCLALKVLVLSKQWPQAQQFVSLLKAQLAKQPTEPPYYPGIRNRYDTFVAQYQSAELIQPGFSVTKGPFGAHLPWAVFDNVPLRKGEFALENEAFAPVMAITYVDGTPDAASFLPAAVDAVNNILFGTLACSVIIHPVTEAQCKPQLEKALEDLRFGSVCVNVAPTIGFALDTATWGGHGGSHTLEEAGSGFGDVHNALMIDNVQKSVVRVKFASSIVGSGKESPIRARAKALAITDLLLRPGGLRLVKVIWVMLPDKVQAILRVLFLLLVARTCLWLFRR